MNELNRKDCERIAIVIKPLINYVDLILDCEPIKNLKQVLNQMHKIQVH